MKKYVVYSRLSKEEKKKAKIQFNKSKKGSELNPIYTRLLLESAVAILFSVGLAIYTFVSDIAWWYFIISGILFVFGIVLLIAEFILRRKVIERMLNQ